jgi:CRISPR-associated protein Cas1
VSYHILNIESVGSTVTCKDRQVVCIEQDGTSRSVPIEDVGSIVVTSFKTSLTNRLLVEAARHGVAVIVCDGFQPASILLPVNRSSDTLLTRAHLGIHARQRSLLWRRTIHAKVRNQWLLCKKWSPAHRGTVALEQMQDTSDSHKEALAARRHWRVFAEAIGQPSFRRDREGGGVNTLLNYGYGVLLSVVMQRMLAVGIDPTFGIAHVPREKSVPLAYDLMEPFRPLVDAEVVACIRRHGGLDSVVMDREVRATLAEVMVRPVRRGDQAVEARIVIEDVLRSFRRAVMDRKPSFYQPWTPKASRWDGCS